MRDPYRETESGARVHELANLVGDGILLGGGTRVDAFVTITGNVKIGKCCHISTGANIFGGGGVEMGDYSGISPGVQVFSSTEDVSGRTLMHPTADGRREPASAPVKIGSHCSVGANSVVLPGSTLLDGTVIGALSMVPSGSWLEPWAIHCGIPVKMIRTRSRECLELVP